MLKATAGSCALPAVPAKRSSNQWLNWLSGYMSVARLAPLLSIAADRRSFSFVSGVKELDIAIIHNLNSSISPTPRKFSGFFSKALRTPSGREAWIGVLILSA